MKHIWLAPQDDMRLMPEKGEFGVCDECGDYTEELLLMEGHWLCRSCSRMPEMNKPEE